MRIRNAIQPFRFTWMILAILIAICTFGLPANALAQPLPDDYDKDGDGLLNAFEESTLSRFAPIFVYDEEEHNILLKQEPEAFNRLKGVVYLYQVSPVDCELDFSSLVKPVYKNYTSLDDPEHPPTVLLTIAAVYPYDYVPVDTVLTDEDDTFAHNGDIEVTKMCLRKESSSGSSYDLGFLHLRRHGSDYLYLPQELEWRMYNTYDHPVLYVSEGKHATFSSKKECGEDVSGALWLFWDEDCGEGKEIVPVAYEKTTNVFYNVGEYEPGKSLTLEDLKIGDHFRHSVNQLGAGYMQEYIWTANSADKNHRESYFCGGADVTNYTGTHKVYGAHTAENCPGGLHFKWWQTKLPAAANPAPPAQPVQSGASGSQCMQYNTDRYGNDLYKIELDAANQNLCMAECLSNPDCVSYAYVSPGIQAENALCYIKGAAGTPKAMQGVISGLRSACEKEFVDGACMAVDVDRYGSDYERFEMEQPDPYACLAACMKDNRCSMYAFLAPGIQSDNAVCYLKSGSPPAPSSTRGVISGKIGSCLR